MTRRRIGIFGGSYNPVHIGHTSLADFISQTGLVDEVWMTVTPANPLKKSAEASETDRLTMLRLATDSNPRLHVCDIELSMPRPSYTINTLDRLTATYPDFDFTLITGADNIAIFDRWRDYNRLLHDFGVIVYPRPGYDNVDIPDGATLLADAPLIDISSTEIRRAIADGKNVNNLLNPKVYKYILDHKIYI